MTNNNDNQSSALRGLQNLVLDLVREFFVGSREFNGISLSELARRLKVPAKTLRRPLRALVRSGKVSLCFAKASVNAHIKRLTDLPTVDQLHRLDEALKGEDQCCAYPSADVIRSNTDLAPVEGRPFTKRLALAEAHLVPVFFTLDVLDNYFRDSRYLFSFNDYEGSISVATKHYDSADVAAKDKILVQSFGIGYDQNRRRVVAVFLRYLSDLSPEHQQRWQSHIVSSPCTMNSDYERASIWGEWPEFHSGYDAVVANQIAINKLCVLIGKPPLFRKTERPKEFIPMLRPTRRNLREFALLCDQLLSDNINKDFFSGDVDLERQKVAEDGTVERTQKATIALLEEWLDSRYTTTDGERMGKNIGEVLRDVRKLRMGPAHSPGEDDYDLDYPKQQDALVAGVVHALTKLRLVLMSHPKTRRVYSAPKWLDGDRIVFY